MRALAQRASNFFLLSAVAVFWLSGGQAARAGGGGPDFTSLQNYIEFICTTVAEALSITISCPQVPTISQGVLELSALHDNTLEAARSQFAIPVAPYVDAANPSRPPAVPDETCVTTSCVDPLNPITGLPIDPSALSTLRPLAFISAENINGTAKPTQLNDADANIFFYVVGGASSTSTVDSLEPDTLLLFYEILRQDEDDRHIFVSRPLRASFSLPLTVLNSDLMTERAVPAILQYNAPAPGGNTLPAPCSASTITGSFSGSGTQTLSPAALGIDCAVTFGATPVSSHPHPVFEISIPLLVTFNTDPIIVYNYYGFGRGRSSNAFPDDNQGFKLPASCPGNNCILGANGFSIGIAPSAGPLEPPTCGNPTPLCTDPSVPPYKFSLCANLPTKGRLAPPVPAVAAFYAIAGNGADVLVSAPLEPTPPGLVCPAM
jgi:hypothetical protein